MALCLLGLGANLGDRLTALGAAAGLLESTEGVTVLAQSRWRESAPAGGPVGQPPFLNGALLIETSLSPQQLLARLQAIEDALGRVRGERWGPRTIDLDLLLYDRVVMDSPNLVLPHPRMAYRRFVLEPAAEIAPDLAHPTIGWTMRQLREHLLRAPPYVALAGPMGVGKTEVARLVAAARPVRLILEPHDATEFASLAVDPAGPSWQAAIEFLDRRRRLLDRATWPTANQPVSAATRWVLSDFWFDQCFAYASVWLDEPRRTAFERLWLETRAGVVPPKLLIVLDATPEVLAERLARGGRADEQAVAVHRRLETREAVLRLAARPGLGPVLRLVDCDSAQAAEEVIAAMQAME